MMYTGSIGLAEFPQEKNPTYELYLALYLPYMLIKMHQTDPEVCIW
jgi:hypothetical protein